MNEKQQHLTFDKGITNVPSDFICSDNALQDCVGMTYADGEHKVIQEPVIYGDTLPRGGTLVYIHNDRRIYTKNSNLYWDNDSEDLLICSFTGELNIDAVGNILIVSCADGIKYAKWNGTDYTCFTNLPDITFIPYLESAENPFQGRKQLMENDTYGVIADTWFVFNDGTTQEGRSGGLSNSYKFHLSTENEYDKTFQNAVTGMVEECIEDIKKEKAFVYPFLIRFALELYDGSITKHTAPMVMFPSVRTGITLQQLDSGGNTPTHQDASTTDNGWFCPEAYISHLRFYLSCANISGFEDIVKSVKVYITRDVRTEKINDNKWDFYNPVENISRTLKRTHDRVVTPYNESSIESSSYSVGYMDVLPNDGTGVKPFYTSRIYAPQRSDADIIRDLMESSVFYELCEIPYSQLVDDMSADHHQTYFAENLIRDYTLENIETQTQMPHDDFYSHTTMEKGSLFSYNSRINVYDFKRVAFDGFKIFMIDNTSSYDFATVVSIQTESGVLSVVQTFESIHIMGKYFYYPDPRANRADIYIKISGTWKLLNSLPLKEHPYLNGAYSFTELPSGDVPYTSYSETSVNPDTLSSVSIEELPNTIMTSEVNNPFVFYSEGSNRIGDSRILGLATQAVALSSGTEFGSQPLIVFTEKGLWSMAVSKEGLYDYTKPLPREVCNNPKSITQTDGLVFFSSEKGLMVVSGSVVKCVSEQLSGKSDTPFQDFLKTAVIAYDYRDSLLWIFDAATHQEGGVDVVGSNYCYIYNIKSSSFSRYILDGEVTMKGEAVAHFETFSSLQTHLSELGLTTGDLVLLDSSADYYESFETEVHIGIQVPTVMEYNAPAPDFTWNTYFPSANEAYLVGNTIWAVTGEEEWRTIRRIRNVVSDYPDFLLQSGDSVLTLLKRPNINSDDTEYFTKITSRPMKLENSLALKSIMQLRNIKQINGTLELTIEASNDIEHWVEINSMRGIPWKYYRFSYQFSNLKATDTFSGTVLITQERRTNKLR